MNGENIVRFVKSQRLTWLWPVKRVLKERIALKILDVEMYGTREGGRPRRIQNGCHQMVGAV